MQMQVESGITMEEIAEMLRNNRDLGSGRSDAPQRQQSSGGNNLVL